MKIAIIATFCHPSRLPMKEMSCMQPAAPELIAGLCPSYAEIEIYNEKETAIPFDRHWDLVFFSYLDSHYEHAKVLSTLLRRAGMTTVAGGRHASRFAGDCRYYFDSVVIGEPEGSVPKLIQDFTGKQLQPFYYSPPTDARNIQPYRYDLMDFRTNRFRGPSVEASRGCPFQCNFCIIAGYERYRPRPIADVIHDIKTRMTWNHNFGGYFKNTFVFYDNNLGGSPHYLRDLCEALLPLKKTWGCSLSLDLLSNTNLVKLMAKSGCRYLYVGLESLNPESINSINKKQNCLRHLQEVLNHALACGILVSFGLLIGTDGDTNEYLQRVPDYLSDLKFFGITFLGIVCPYPGTAFFAKLLKEGRMLPGTMARDLDGYTLCHRPKRVTPHELVEHYRSMSASLSKLTNIARHCWSKIWKSNTPSYKTAVILTVPEFRSIRRNLLNKERTYLAGLDPIEQWDQQKMHELGIEPQAIVPKENLR